MSVDPKAETPNQRSDVHYYDDGDLLIIVEKTEFRVHKLLLKLASEMFRSMFACKVSQDGPLDNAKPIDSVVITDMTADEFNDILTFIYPHTILDISWSKLSYLLSIADKYIMMNLTEYCLRFLEANFLDRALDMLSLADRALTAFSLSDQHRSTFSFLYKESSKYVLDDIGLVFTNSLPVDLSNQTRNKLIEARCRYFETISSLSLDTLNIQTSPSGARVLKNGLAEICILPLQPPSVVWKKLHELFKKAHMDSLQDKLDAMVEELLGPYEIGTYDDSGNCYMFLEYQ
ncbi:2969_t:CDS:1 [Paraglomus occultum]|uniref:2969_t:CDS:1 n=1 Tax=Paraglomus occultum TaxID=144539 RepID=A0A9N8ZFH4_9GLOM|nr:2969_t:CDS:1 [Paraglomus occultum]